MNIVLANPRGFCAGVERAIEIVERALDIFEAPIYVRHEVVHNKKVVQDLESKGVVFVDEIADIPEGETAIFSAHGVSLDIRAQAENRNLKIFDATCPLVTKVHLEVAKAAKEQRECILIGHRGHPEVEGTLGQYTNQQGHIYLVEAIEDVAKLDVKNPQKLSFVTQTTLSVDDSRVIIDALKKRYPDIVGPRKDDICYATQNRQDAVKELAACCDLVLVVGSANSSNSNRLCELAQKMGVPSYLIDHASEIKQQWLNGVKNVGVTAGASAPELLVEQVVAYLKACGEENTVENLDGPKEDITFTLPKSLQKAS